MSGGAAVPGVVTPSGGVAVPGVAAAPASVLARSGGRATVSVRAFVPAVAVAAGVVVASRSPVPLVLSIAFVVVYH